MRRRASNRTIRCCDTVNLRDVLLKGSRHIDRFLQLVEEGHQAPDHPVHPAIPETAYLKAFFARLLPS
jgi:23S rRNA (cytosine1962-C5)-methyltransferase